MEVKGLHTLLCEVTDMDRATAFYRDVVGFEVTYENPHWTSLRAGQTNVGLHPPFERSTETRGGGWIFGIEVDDIRGYRERLVASGVAVTDFHDTPSGAIIEFADADGNRIQAIQPGVMREHLSA